MIQDKYLPIGTVVMLRSGTKRVMITGFCTSTADNNKKVYDYSGCLYPEGIISSDQTLLFDHDNVIAVYFTGFIDEEQQEFEVKLKDLVQKVGTGEVALEQPPNIAVDSVPPVSSPSNEPNQAPLISEIDPHQHIESIF